MYIRILLQIMYTCFSQNLIGVKNKHNLKKKIISKRKIIFTSSKNCFIMCSGSWPGFFSVTFGLAFRLKISGCRSLVNPGSTSVDDSAVVILFSLKKKRKFKVHWRVILNNESNNRSHILGSLGSVCPLPYHIR